MNQTTVYPRVFNCGTDKRLPEKVRINLLILFVFGVLFMTLTILLNSTTIATYWKSTKLKKSTGNFMIMVLSSNDLVVGLTSNIAFLTLVWTEYSSGTTQCQMYAYPVHLQIFSSGCSLMTLVVMSLERYGAICHPFYHRTKITKRFLMKCLVFLWIQVGFVTSMVGRFFIVFFSVVILEISLSVFLLFFIYVKIFRTYRRQFSIRVQRSDEASQRRKENISEKKLSKSCLIVVLSLAMCYLPLVLLEVIHQVIVNIIPDAYYILSYWCIAFVLLNSSVNSIVFFWRIKVLRVEAFATIKTLINLKCD